VKIEKKKGGARRSQEEPGIARRSREEPGGARRSQENSQEKSFDLPGLSCVLWS
jgi:hypothetical protein